MFLCHFLSIWCEFINLSLEIPPRNKYLTELNPNFIPPKRKCSRLQISPFFFFVKKYLAPLPLSPTLCSINPNSGVEWTYVLFFILSTSALCVQMPKRRGLKQPKKENIWCWYSKALLKHFSPHNLFFIYFTIDLTSKSYPCVATCQKSTSTFNNNLINVIYI